MYCIVHLIRMFMLLPKPEQVLGSEKMATNSMKTIKKKKKHFYLFSLPLCHDMKKTLAPAQKYMRCDTKVSEML